MCAFLAIAGIAVSQDQGKTQDDPPVAQLDQTSNPYLAPKDATVPVLVIYLERMRDKPETIRRRELFGAALIDAAERVLKAEPNDEQRTVAAIALFDTLHERAVLGNEQANGQLMDWAVILKDDTQEPIAQRAGLHLLEARVIDARGNELTTDEVKQLLVDLESYFTDNEISSVHLRLASETIGLINTIDGDEERNGLFDKFGALFANSEDRDLQMYASKILAKPGVDTSEMIGKPLELEGTTLEGTPLDWDSYRGKVVLVDFWATWCAPCVQELPNVKAAYEKYHEAGFEVIGVSLDRDINDLTKFVRENRIPWVNVYDEGHPMAEKYGVNAIPRPILIDREGNVVHTQARGEVLTQQIEKLLAARRDSGD